MTPALEYVSSIWSPLASSTSINKRKVMQNAALRTATRHKHTPSTWRNTHTSHPYFNNGRYTLSIPTYPYTVTTTDIKTNMRHIHTSIVSRHLATRGNNKIMRAHPPHTSSSEEILPRLTRRTLAQLRTNKSPFLKVYLHKVDAKHIHHHYSPSATPDIHTISSTAPKYAPYYHPWICG